MITLKEIIAQQKKDMNKYEYKTIIQMCKKPRPQKIKRKK